MKQPEEKADLLDQAIAHLIRAEDIIEELGMEIELDRLTEAVDPIVYERDYIVTTDLSEVEPRTFTGIYQPQLERKL